MNARERAMAAHPAGKGVPVSAEVEQERMDREACALGSSNSRHVPTPTRWQNIRAVAGIIAGFALVANAGPIASAVTGWIA